MSWVWAETRCHRIVNMRHESQCTLSSAVNQGVSGYSLDSAAELQCFNLPAVYIITIFLYMVKSPPYSYKLPTSKTCRVVILHDEWLCLLTQRYCNHYPIHIKRTDMQKIPLYSNETLTRPITTVAISASRTYSFTTSPMHKWLHTYTSSSCSTYGQSASWYITIHSPKHLINRQNT